MRPLLVGDEPISVLFLCTANAARSQIAEALLRRRGGKNFRVASAGTYPADRIHPEAVEALAEIGIDWSYQRPKGFDAVASESWDLVITLCDRLKETCAAVPGRPVYAHWGVPDPIAVHPSQRLDACRHTLNLPRVAHRPDARDPDRVAESACARTAPPCDRTHEP